jgi:endonuclease/exonuclease/phosphatase family metal-dependent hydrolase
LAQSGTFNIPFFNGHLRAMPIVQLRSIRTARTVTVVNVHNPADTRRYPRQARRRAEPVSREITLVNRLNRSRQVVLTGDLNDRRDAFCRVVTATSLRPQPTGPAHPCQPPQGSGIDWIFASRGSATTSPALDRHPLEAGISDHPMLTWRLGN